MSIPHVVDRRELFSIGAITAAAPMLFLPGRAEAAESVTVEIASGKLKGQRDRRAISFKGVPYAADTSGRNRFMAPQPPAAWTGVRDALQFGERSPQVRRPAPASTPPALYGENCCVLNVYTAGLDARARRPVMVYFHGGGFSAGSGDAPDLDGANLARAGDVVVVTVNHRLNVFGYANLGFLDAAFADACNVGQLDLIAALRWVKANIGVFGGDGDQITLFGQSGGGSKGTALLLAPGATGLFRRTINMSGSSGFGMKHASEREAVTIEFLKNLNVGRGELRRLQEVPAEQLLAAHDRAIDTLKSGDYRPVVDGRHIFHGPLTREGAALQAALPSIMSCASTEATFWLSANRDNFAVTADQVNARIARHYGFDSAKAGSIMDAFRQDDPSRTPFDILIAVASEAMVTIPMRRALEMRADARRAPVYSEQFTWRSPLDGGIWGSPHTIDIPFAFGNLDRNRFTADAGPGDQDVSRNEMAAFVAFARGGNPNNPRMPKWEPFDTTRRRTMVVDRQCRLVDDYHPGDRRAAAPLPVEDALAVMRGPLYQGL